MSKVKIGFSGLSVPEQIERGRLIIGKMTGNANYTTPSPTLVVVGGAADALETAYNASRGHDKELVALMKLRRIDLLFVIGQLAAYVQLTSDGDEEKILSSGFSVRSARVIHPDIAGPVFNVQLTDGSNSGKIKVTWDEASDAVIYILEGSTSIDFPGNDNVLGCTTRTQKEIGGLTPGTRYWIKVRALGKEEGGPESEAISILVR